MAYYNDRHYSEQDYVLVPKHAYLQALEARRREIEPRGWKIPDGVWEDFLSLIGDCGVDPEHSDPALLVDSFALDKQFGYIDDEKNEGESDEDFVERMEREGNDYTYFWDDRSFRIN